MIVLQLPVKCRRILVRSRTERYRNKSSVPVAWDISLLWSSKYKEMCWLLFRKYEIILLSAFLNFVRKLINYIFTFSCISSKKKDYFEKEEKKNKLQVAINNKKRITSL